MDFSFLIAAAIAAAFVLVTGPFVIPELHKLKFGQYIRELGPESHQAKSGTPTMGGIMIILGITIATLIMAPHNHAVLLALFIMLGHFVLGFLDDYIKVVKKQNLGLKKKYKMLGQVIIAVIVAFISAEYMHFDTTVWIPYFDVKLDLGMGGYYFFMLFFIVAMSNAVNFTDGLDGLASGVTAIAASCYGVACVLLGYPDVAIFCGAIMGACVGFLRFNVHPAKIFMGDTGSLALGGAMAGVGIVTRSEVLCGMIGFIFFLEALSVVIQIASFRSTGKRVFRMAPIHHHFELCGWSETKVVYVFWMVGLLAGVITLSLIKTV